MGLKSTRSKINGILGKFNTNRSISGSRGSNYFPPIGATGGNTVTTLGSFNYHIFTSPGTFSIAASTPAPNFAKVLMVGGGGTFGPVPANEAGGGGGAGGVLLGDITLTAGSYSIVVGGAGANTTGFGVTAFAGGAGGRYGGPTGPNGSPGGSGGGGQGIPGGSGGAATQTPAVTPYGTLIGYGNPGKPNPGGSNPKGGGGGGAGGAAPGINGGVGLSTSWIPSSLPGAPPNGYFAGGGGGAEKLPENPGNGTPGSGALGWGGGGYRNGPTGLAGVVVIAYPTAV